MQAIQESLAKKVPDEPPEGCTEVTCTLRIRTPDRQMLLRRFYGSNKLEAVTNFITSKGFHMSDYKLLTTFPRRDVSFKFVIFSLSVIQRKSRSIVIAISSSLSSKNFDVAQYSKSIKDINTKLGMLAYPDKNHLQNKWHNSESYSFGVMPLLI